MSDDSMLPSTSFITKIELTNVAGHTHTIVNFDNEVNIISWSNSMGKTKFLELLRNVWELGDPSNREHLLFRNPDGSYREGEIRITLTTPDIEEIILEVTLSPDGEHTDRYSLQIDGEGVGDKSHLILKKFYSIIEEDHRNLMLKVMLPKLYIENVKRILEDADKTFFIDRLSFLVASLQLLQKYGTHNIDRMLDDLRFTASIELSMTEAREKVPFLLQTKNSELNTIKTQLTTKRELQLEIQEQLKEITAFLEANKNTFTEYQKKQTQLSNLLEHIKKFEETIRFIKQKKKVYQDRFDELGPKINEIEQQVEKSNPEIEGLASEIGEKDREYNHKLHQLDAYRKELSKLEEMLNTKTDERRAKIRELKALTKRFGQLPEGLIPSMDKEGHIIKENISVIHRQLNHLIAQLQKKINSIRKSSEYQLTEATKSLYANALTILEFENQNDILCPLCQSSHSSDSLVPKVKQHEDEWTKKYEKLLKKISGIETNAEKLKQIQEEELGRIIQLQEFEIPELDDIITSLEDQRGGYQQGIVDLSNEVTTYPEEEQERLRRYNSLNVRMQELRRKTRDLQHSQSHITDDLALISDDEAQAQHELDRLLDKKKNLESTIQQVMPPDVSKEYESKLSKNEELGNKLTELRREIKTFEEEYINLGTCIELLTGLDDEMKLAESYPIAYKIFQELLDEYKRKLQKYLQGGLTPIMERLGVPFEGLVFKGDIVYAKLRVGNDQIPALVSLPELSSSEIVRLMISFLWIQKPFNRGLGNYFIDTEALDKETVNALLVLLQSIGCTNITLFTVPPYQHEPPPS